uniref:Glycine-rich protein n=1 Tax=Populus davidiana TaxID=266767 RepID=A0A6M2FBV1_9ROSI
MGDGNKMGYLFLVLLVLASLCLFASSTDPLHDHKPLLSDSTTSNTDLLQENSSGATGTHQHDTSSIGDDSSERSGIVHSSKFAHGSVYGGTHGGATDTSNGGGDEHGSGAAVPVVVTGAVMNHHPNKHHNAASHQANGIVLPILITTALVALIVR